MDSNIHNIKSKEIYKRNIISDELNRNDNKANIPMSYYFPDGKHKIPENIHPKFYKVMPNLNNYSTSLFDEYNKEYVVKIFYNLGKT